MAVPAESTIRVLMTTDGIGGVWNYSIRLAGALEAYGVQIALATMGPALSESQRQQVRRLSHVQLYESTFKLEWMRDPWPDVDRAGQWLLGLAEGLKPDLVHLNGYVHAAMPWPSPTLVVGHSCVCSWFEAVRKCNPTPQWNEYCRRVRLGLSPTTSLRPRPPRPSTRFASITDPSDRPGRSTTAWTTRAIICRGPMMWCSVLVVCGTRPRTLPRSTGRHRISVCPSWRPGRPRDPTARESA